MNKISYLSIIVLCFLTVILTTLEVYADEIPSLPPDFSGVDLTENFNEVVNNGGGFAFSNDNSILQLTDNTSQATAIWGKNKIDLTKPFKLQFYFYLGDKGAAAADGVVFGLQQYSSSFMGDKGNGMGFFNTLAYKVGVEFDTYFNGDGPDSYTGSGGNNGLNNQNNHMAVTTSGQTWTNYQYHYSASQLPDGKYFSNGAWKKVTIEGKPISGESTQTTLSYSMYDLEYKTTISGETMIDFNSNPEDYSSHHFLLTKDVYWGFTSSTGESSETAAMSFGILPQKPAIAVQNVTIYEGENWDASQNFVNGHDETATEFSYDDERLSEENNVDTTKPGEYYVNYNYNNDNFTGSAEAIVTVLEDKSTIKTVNSEIYIGQTWDKQSNFASATDEDGINVSWGDSRITDNGATVDTNKVGVYPLKYTYKGKIKSSDSSFSVTVKEDKSSISTKDSTINVGDTWNKESNFEGATDEDGEKVAWGDSRITDNNAAIDTKIPGVYSIKYTYKGKNKNVDSEFKVTVKEQLTLSVPSIYDFGQYQLGDENAVLTWDKSSAVKVEGSDKAKWSLAVSIPTESSLANYLKVGNKIVTDEPIEIISGQGSTIITDTINSEDFLKVDYSDMKSVRKDSGFIQWTLTPATQEVEE